MYIFSTIENKEKDDNMVTAQLRHDSTQKLSNISENKSTTSEHFELLHDLDLRYLIENSQPILNISELNQTDTTDSDAKLENISYSLGLLSYALGLFGIAYWTLVLPKAWLLLGGLSAIAFGIKLFFSPIKIFNPNLRKTG